MDIAKRNLKFEVTLLLERKRSVTPCPSGTPQQDLPLEHDLPGRAGQRGEGHAGRRYQHVFRRANILPYFSHVQCLYSISKYLINHSVLTFHFIEFNA